MSTQTILPENTRPKNTSSNNNTNNIRNYNKIMPTKCVYSMVGAVQCFFLLCVRLIWEFNHLFSLKCVAFIQSPGLHTQFSFSIYSTMRNFKNKHITTSAHFIHCVCLCVCRPLYYYHDLSNEFYDIWQKLTKQNQMK